MNPLTQEQIRTLQSDPKAAETYVDEVVRVKPVGWSRKSNATYYNESSALDVKDVLDKMLETKKDMVIPLRGRSLATMYAKVHQGLYYLFDYMDADGKYKALRDSITICRRRGAGVLLMFDHKESLGAVAVENTPQQV